jgi:tetratricopeptide (TPR) repeat protein
VTTSDRFVAEPPTRSSSAPGSAADLWVRARNRVDFGRPATGLKLGARALEHLRTEHVPEGQAAVLRSRILVTMADAQVELGRTAEADDLLDAALQQSATALPMVQASRGVLLARTGRLPEARQQLDAGVAALSQSSRPSANLVRALLWRGLLHLSEARLDAAQADCEVVVELGRSTGMDPAVAVATHNLGLVRWVSGDLPGALHEMALADEVAHDVRAGIRSLDRARVLLAAGLLLEAREFADRAERVFASERAKVDLADALLVQAEIDIVARRAKAARSAARRSARNYALAGYERGVLAARVMEVRAEANVRAAIRPLPRRQALQDASAADALVTDLLTAGQQEDARAVRLLQAEALLQAGDLPAAETAAEAAAGLGAGNGSANRAARVPLIATELHTQVIAARIELAHGRRSSGLAHIRRGLDDLAAYQARFGSQDLQSASAVHGSELTRLGLRTALQTRSPAAILQWLERSRAASTRLAAVRPSMDGVLARELSKLRMASYRARMALLAGAADPDIEDEVDQLRRRVRSRSWGVVGTGAVNRPLPLAAVQRRLADTGERISVVAPFRGNGQFHALVITSGTARYVPLGPDFGLEYHLQRIIGDLNVLADHRIMQALRSVADVSLRAGLGRVARFIVDPLLPFVDQGPIVVAAAGSAAIVPWALLPGLDGRAVSVSPSVTAAVAHLGQTRQVHRRGVLAVAGPEVPHAGREVDSVLAAYRPAPTDASKNGSTSQLTGPAATGRAVLEAIPAGGLLHIAAHGHHEPDNPLFSGVLLADGLLYGYDVAPNPSIPAQVVLSSCDVGRTDDRPGSEPLGLVAALLRSGVSTVIAGTSRVSDQVAASVMAAYHQRLSADQAPAIALAGAIATTAGSGADPAPFTCFGAGL